MTFQLRAFTLAPGCERAYDEAQWRDAIVLVACGEVELECVSGGARRFRAGDTLWLAPLPLRLLRNRGPGPAVLLAVSRRRPAGPDAACRPRLYLCR